MNNLIELKELRIGNYLSYDNKIVYVTSLSLDIDDEYEDQIGFCNVGESSNEKGGWNRSLVDKLAPIPLTPEWLERCGFIGLNHLGRKEYSLVIDEELTIEVCFGDQLIVRLVIINDNYDENINLGQFVTYRHVRGCNYLHQLQNLYFALTGEELTIKQVI